MNISAEQANVLRQWFDSLLDTHPEYLEKKDFEMAIELYRACGMRVPYRIEREVIIVPQKVIL